MTRSEPFFAAHAALPAATETPCAAPGRLRVRAGAARQTRMPRHRYLAFAPALLLTLTACDGWTDAATRVAYDIEAGAARLGTATGG